MFRQMLQSQLSQRSSANVRDALTIATSIFVAARA